MKKSRYSEEQIIAVLKEHQAGIWCRALPQARGQRSDGLQLAVTLRWDGDFRGSAAEEPRGREPQAEEAAGRVDARCSHAP